MIIAEFSAPYRTAVIDELCKKWNADVFFELEQDDKREKSWLRCSDNYYLLSTKKGFSRFIKCIKAICTYDCVLIFNNSLKYSIILEIICKIKRVPFVLTCDGCYKIKTRNFVKYLFKRMLINGAAGYLAGGDAAIDYFSYYGVERRKISKQFFSSTYRKNFIDVFPDYEEKQSNRIRCGIKEKYVILSVGRHIPCKGFDILALVAERLGDNYGIYIIGGQPNDSLVRFCNEHFINNIHFLPFMNSHKLKSYYLMSDIFVLMTRGDTWGLVINEAMECALPVITTDRCVAGVELIKNGINGFVIDVDDVDTLEDRIKYLANNPDIAQKIGENNVLKIKDYTLDHMSEVFIDTISNIVKK